MAQTAIDEAEKGDYSEVKRILSLLQKPFDDWPAADADGDVTSCHLVPGKPSSSLSTFLPYLTYKCKLK